MLTGADIRSRVKEAPNFENPPWWRRPIDKGVVSKPSVTLHMILLSLAALIFWTCMFAFNGWLWLNAPEAPPIAASAAAGPTASPTAAATTQLPPATEPAAEAAQ